MIRGVFNTIFILESASNPSNEYEQPMETYNSRIGKYRF